MKKDYLTKSELERYETIIKNYEDKETGIKLFREFGYLEYISVRLFGPIENSSLSDKRLSLLIRLSDIYAKKGILNWTNRDSKLKYFPGSRIFKEASN